MNKFMLYPIDNTKCEGITEVLNNHPNVIKATWSAVPDSPVIVLVDTALSVILNQSGLNKVIQTVELDV